MEVRLCNEPIERELVEAFCRQVFDPGKSLNRPNERRADDSSPQNPYASGPSPTAIAIHEGTIVGHVTSTPFRLWLAGSEQSAYWLGGIHVLPEYRGKGIARELAACITNSLPIVTGVARVEPSIKAFKATDWVWPGLIADYIHIVNPTTFLSHMNGSKIERFVPTRLRSSADLGLKLLRGPMKLGLRAWRGLALTRSSVEKGRTVPCAQVTAFDPEIDALWERERSNFSLTNVRRAEYINWQFPTIRGWEKVVYSESADIKAWAIYTTKTYHDGGQLDGLKALNVIDALWDSRDAAVLSDLIKYFLYRGYEENVDIIMVSGTHPQLAKALSKSAFFKLPSTIFAGFHSRDIKYDFAGLYRDSYITRGYADAAGGLGPE